MEVFVKVYFGNENPEASRIDAENESLLRAHFGPRVQTLARVELVPLVDAWGSESFSCVAFEWVEIFPRSLPEVLVDPSLCGALRDLLGALAVTPAPAGWDRDRETHNFALTDYSRHDFATAAAFDVDLPLNLGASAGGRLLFHDFEKFQWSSPGLQAAHLAAWLEIDGGRRGCDPPRREMAAALASFEPAIWIARLPSCRPIVDRQLRAQGKAPTSDIEWAKATHAIVATFEQEAPVWNNSSVDV